MHGAALVQFILGLFFLSIHPVSAQFKAQVCDATAEKPCLVQDSNSQISSIKWMRDASTITGEYQGNTEGIQELYLTGSEEPSERGWNEIAEYIKKRNKHDKPIYVLDLRQESHGYLNGKAITIADQYNWLNINKSNEQINLDQEAWLSQFKNQKTANDVITIKQFTERDFSHGKTLALYSVKSEEEYVKKLGFHYYRMYITDHRSPRDSEVDAFIALVKKVPKKTWFHVHCRGGKGRTTTVFAMLDMLKNADKVSFHEIIARQASISPYYNLFELNRGDPFLTIYYEQRVRFLTEFYEYSRQFLAGYTGTWSEWRAVNHLT